MSEGMAGEQERADAPAGPLIAPVDERIARMRPRPGTAILERGLFWLILLAASLVLQRAGVRWEVADGRLRVAMELALLALGFAGGLLLGAADDFPWLRWPPQGTLQHRRTRFTAAALAHGWWQYLWVLPFATLSAVLVVVLVVMGWLRPNEMAGTLYASDLVWSVLVAAAAGAVLGRRLLRPGAEAITERGMHTSPVSFVAWGQLSHALVDAEEGIIRLYTRRRPWMPRDILVYASAEDAVRVAELLAPHLTCLTRDREPKGNRVRWAVFLALLLAGVAALTAGLFALVFAPSAVFALAAAARVAPTIVEIMELIPPLIFPLVLLIGVVIDMSLEELRGITTKRITVVSEQSAVSSRQ